MPTLNAKCPGCGAIQKVDGSKDACICEQCGNAFVVEQAVQNYYSVENYTSDETTEISVVNNTANTKTSGSSIEPSITKGGNFCVKCGTENTKNSVFCAKCGARMIGENPTIPVSNSISPDSKPTKGFPFIPIIALSVVVIAVILAITVLKPVVQKKMAISQVKNGVLYKYDYGVSIGDALHEWFNGTEEWGVYDENGVRNVTAMGSTKYTLSGKEEAEVFIFQLSGDRFQFMGAFDQSGNYIATTSGNAYADIGVNLFNSILGLTGTDLYDLYCQAAFGNQEVLNSLKGEDSSSNTADNPASVDNNDSNNNNTTTDNASQNTNPPNVDTNNRTQADYNELMNTIISYYSVYYGTNNVDAEIDHETSNSVVFRLFDPYANTTSDTLGFYEYNWNSGVWTDGITGEPLDI